MAMEVKQKINFLKMDTFDQLQQMDEKFRKKLIYEVRTYDEKTKQTEISYNLTFVGIKQLVLELAQKGQPLEIIGEPKVWREKIDDNPLNDRWYAEVRLRNKATNQESWGVAESPVFPWQNVPVLDQEGRKIWIDNPSFPGKKMLKTERKQVYDNFGRTAAVSKAIRNAERQHLPEFTIQLFVEKALKDKSTVQRVDDLDETGMPVDNEIDFCSCKEKGRGDPMTGIDGICKRCGQMVKAWWDYQKKQGMK